MSSEGTVDASHEPLSAWEREAFTVATLARKYPAVFHESRMIAMTLEGWDFDDGPRCLWPGRAMLAV